MFPKIRSPKAGANKRYNYSKNLSGCNYLFSKGLSTYTQDTYIPYTTKFSLDKNFAKHSYLCVAEIFGGINFCQCGKGHHILNVIINTGQKIRVTKISPIKADGKIGKNFLLAKISVCTVHEIVYDVL